MHHDRTPWGPAVVALVFLVLGATAVVRFADELAVWIVAVPCVAIAGWQARTALRRHLSDDETRD